MKKEGIYYCAICNTHTGVLHEIIFGQCWRDISIEANLQLPLCQHCHDAAHGKKHSIKTYPNYAAMEFSRYTQAQAETRLLNMLAVEAQRMIYYFNNLTTVCGKQARKMIMTDKDYRAARIRAYLV